jgi:hypothetical protein
MALKVRGFKSQCAARIVPSVPAATVTRRLSRPAARPLTMVPAGAHPLTTNFRQVSTRPTRAPGTIECLIEVWLTA